MDEMGPDHNIDTARSPNAPQPLPRLSFKSAAAHTPVRRRLLHPIPPPCPLPQTEKPAPAAAAAGAGFVC